MRLKHSLAVLDLASDPRQNKLQRNCYTNLLCVTYTEPPNEFGMKVVGRGR